MARWRWPPYSYGLSKRHVDGMVRVSDDALSQAMYDTFCEMNLAV